MSLRPARHEVDELFDTEMIRLARQVQATLVVTPAMPGQALPPPAGDRGEADMRELAIAVWDARRPPAAGRPRGRAAAVPSRGHGFVDMRVDGAAWRIYYLHRRAATGWSPPGRRPTSATSWRRNITLGQVLPWVLMLPVLLLAMTWAVKRASRRCMRSAANCARAAPTT